MRRPESLIRAGALKAEHAGAAIGRAAKRATR